ncbi:MAG: hypothetical protein KKB20_01820 [Proteobacteria bacterium]|nr:hypothetical protein [Pseudomonadota bacterium]
MAKSSTSTLKPLFLAFLAFLAAVCICYYRTTYFPLYLREEVRVVPDHRLAEILSLDHRGFLADMYFIQVSLHSGSLMWKPLKFQFDSDWAYGMMNVITDLDPKFHTAYLFSGMGLIHGLNDVKRARPILEKGMAVFPDNWELPFWIGYDHYNYLEDYETASHFLWQAFQKPNAPKAFLSMMLSALRESGDYERALAAMQVLIAGTTRESLKSVYQAKLIQLQNLAHLQKKARDFKEKFGRWPERLDDLAAKGLIDKIPQDPYGMTYRWKPDRRMVVMEPRKTTP